MKKAFVYKTRMAKNTENNLIKWIALCRLLYNIALQQRIIVWNQQRKSLNYYDQAAELHNLKNEFPEFKLVGSQVLQNVLEKPDLAFKSFFRRLKSKEDPGFPRFRGEARYNSFVLKQAGWKLEGRHLKIKGIGILKPFFSRPLEGKIKTITIKRDNLGEQFVVFVCDIEASQPKYHNELTTDIALDAGLYSLRIDSDGTFIENPRWYRTLEKKLIIVQKSLSRKKKGSKNRKEAKIGVTKVHRKIRNKRSDFLHKIANSYIDRYDVIYVEKLNINGMKQNHKFAKSISDAAWGQFFNLITYKAEYAGKIVIKVNPRGTSQQCSGCGINVKKELSERTHKCINCGLEIHRDLNAAYNILKRGRSALAIMQQDLLLRLAA